MKQQLFLGRGLDYSFAFSWNKRDAPFFYEMTKAQMSEEVGELLEYYGARLDGYCWEDFIFLPTEAAKKKFDTSCFTPFQRHVHKWVENSYSPAEAIFRHLQGEKIHEQGYDYATAFCWNEDHAMDFENITERTMSEQIGELLTFYGAKLDANEKWEDFNFLPKYITGPIEKPVGNTLIYVCILYTEW